MLVEFSVENFKSFRDKTTFSMEATADKKHHDNVIDTGDKKIRLLKTSMIYGANASGKTNLIEAMQLFSNFITMSHTHLSGVKLNHSPFLFDNIHPNRPTSMGIKFLKDGTIYDYSFSYDRDRILSESLMYYPNGRKATVFQRSGQDFEFTNDKRWQTNNAERVMENALYLSVSAQFNYDISKKVVGWIMNDFFVYSGIDPLISIGLLISTMDSDRSFKARVLNAFKIADLGIVDMNDRNNQKGVKKAIRTPMPLPTLESVRPDIWVKHSFKDGLKQKTKELPLRSESAGTVRFMSMIGPIIAALYKGGTVIIDEMDLNFHPELCKWMVGLFHDPMENSKGAQLIFNTHDSELLNLETTRRDQIWFAEKDWESGASSMVSLAEFRERNDRDIRKAYLSGRYGAKPFILPEGLMG